MLYMEPSTFHVLYFCVLFKIPRLATVYSKDEARPRTRHEGPEGEQRYSTILSFTSVLDRVNATPPLYPREKDQLLIAQDAGWAVINVNYILPKNKRAILVTTKDFTGS
jgi:hypothetical protein